MPATKPTLLEIVQTVLSDINGDAVNSISDTEESERVAQNVKNVYRNLVSHTEWPHTRRAVTLVPFSNSSYPTHMRVSEEYKKLLFVNYNTAKLGDSRLMFQEVKYKDPDNFLRYCNGRNNTDATTDTILDPSGIKIMVRNDQAPKYYTSFDDVVLVFDSYDSQVDSTLQESKVQAMAFIIPPFEMEDGAVPDLPLEAFGYLIEETISRCQLKMKEVQDVKSENEAQRQSRWLSQSNFVVNGGVRFPNYGRRSHHQRDVTFQQGRN